MAQGQPQLDLVTTAQPGRQAEAVSELQAGAGHPAATMKSSLQPDLLGAELLLNT